jgi:Uma2 family endonuclease
MATNVAELLEQLGEVPPERIRLQPPPGTAREQDVLIVRDEPERRLCELVDGVLVEKAMGSRESLLAGLILHRLWSFLEAHPLGIVLGADGMLRLWPGLVRIPDVSFISWERIPEKRFPDEAIVELVPELAVEVLSRSNTAKEMNRKLREYFQAGVRLVWVIQPKTQSARAYTSPTQSRRITRTGHLSGGEVVPGFSLALADLFGFTTGPGAAGMREGAPAGEDEG